MASTTRALVIFFGGMQMAVALGCGGQSTPTTTPASEGASQPAPATGGSSAAELPSLCRDVVVTPIHRASEDARAALASGEAHFEAERFEEALEAFERAASLDPGYFNAHLNAGQVAFNLRRYEVALDHYRCAVHLDPQDFLAARKVVQTLHALGRFDAAIAPRREAMRLYQTGRDPMTQRLPGPVIEQIAHRGYTLLVVEVAPTPRTEDPAELVFSYLTLVYGPDGLVFQVVLESNPVMEEQGVAASIAFYHPNGTVGGLMHFEELPTYGAYRPHMISSVETTLRRFGLPLGS